MKVVENVEEIDREMSIVFNEKSKVAVQWRDGYLKLFVSRFCYIF